MKLQKYNLLRLFFLVVLLFVATSSVAQDDPCTHPTTVGRDFWVAYIVNGGAERPRQLQVTAIGDTSCTITVTNPLTAWSQTVSLIGGSSVTVSLPESQAVPQYYSVDENKGFHITSTANIQVVSSYTQLASSGITGVLPTDALGTRYVVLDYPADPSRSSITGATVTIVATENNTTIQYIPPCSLYNSPSSVIGTPVTHLFSSAGQTLTLMTNEADATLSGMEITSNKPIAVFQGNQITGVPYSTPSGDFMYDQSLPVIHWGKTYALVPTVGRTVGDRVRLVSDSACTVTLSSGATYTLDANGVQEFDLPANGTCILTSDKPVSVGLCTKGSDWNAEPGDGSLLMVPPMERGICHSLFTTFNTQRIHTWYLVAVTDQPATMTLNGNNISAQFQSIGTTGYSFARINIDAGDYSLDNSEGLFTAWTYGVGNVESYIYSFGYAYDPAERQLQRDTVVIVDSVCQGEQYNENGFFIDSSQTLTPGTFYFTDSIVDDYYIHYKQLTLVVLPAYDTVITSYFIFGDTVVFLGDTLTEACSRVYQFQTIHGCDSLVTLNLNYAEVLISASKQGVCPGGEVVLTAEETYSYYWGSIPYDSELDGQQEQNPITVHPRVTTTYQLLDASGNVISSVTVGVEPPPTLCVESNRDFIDFDHPVITLHDCSTPRHHSTWTFSDGYYFTGERIRRQFSYPLPDTITLTLTSCNYYDCCADTTIGFRPEIRSVWFPNVFTPDGQQNNRFGPVTSCQIAEFEIFLYNRWGLLVWHSTDIFTPWDGTYDGTPSPQGAYAYKWYVVDIHGDRWSGAGTVTLLR